MDTIPLLTTAQVAARTGIPESTLRYFRTNGKGPDYGKIGRRVMYEPEAVDAWLSEQMESTARGGTKEAAA
ncbi:helix-turn-helix domain-containing protein [Corynebacterium mastitidis]|uniref:helix-turn-helix transcriptional regulator n=1 Tax=Corynebacterium mastitidis TaxID=161890 RepID=UPI0030E95EAC